MQTLNKLVIANLRQNKKRTQATLMAIILSCTFMFSIGIAFSTYRQYNIKKTGKEMGTYHVMYYDVNYESSYHYLKNNKNIKDIYTMQILEQFGDDNQKVQVFAYKGELNKEITLSSGSEPTNETEILISTSSINELGLNVGDSIGKYKIVGTFDNYIKEEYPINEFSFDPNHIITVLTKKSLDSQSEHSCFFVTYKKIKKTYDYLQNDLKELKIPSISTVNVQINKPYLKEYGVGQDNPYYALLYIALALSLYVISIFCMLIIYNAFAISLTERKRQFGILRSLGASKKMIISMITKELLILSLIAFPISFLLGLCLVASGLKILDILLSIKMPLSFDYPTIIITIFFILFSMILSAYTPGRKASKTSPMEAIKTTKEYKIKKSKREYRLTRKIFGSVGQLSRKNLKRNGRQFSTVVTSLTISVILFIIVSMVVNFFTLSYRSYQNDYENQPDISIDVHSQDRESLNNFITELKKIPYMDSIQILRSSFIILNSNNPSYTEEALDNFYHYISIIALDEQNYEEFMKENNITTTKPLLYNVDSYYSEENKINYNVFKENSILVCKRDNGEVSNECGLELTDFELINKPLKIGNEEIDHPTIITTDENLENYMTNYPEYFSKSETQEKIYFIEIQSEHFKEFDNEFQKMQRYKKIDFNYNNYALGTYNDKQKILCIEIVIYIVIIFLGSISIVGMLNSINTNLSLREREFSMLRSMGYSKRSLNKMISLENIFLVSKSFIYALIFTFIGFLALNQTFSYDYDKNEFIFPPIINIPYPWVYTLIAFITVVLLLLFLTSFSIKKIKKQNIIEAIRKDSI